MGSVLYKVKLILNVILFTITEIRDINSPSRKNSMPCNSKQREKISKFFVEVPELKVNQQHDQAPIPRNELETLH